MAHLRSLLTVLGLLAVVWTGAVVVRLGVAGGGVGATARDALLLLVGAGLLGLLAAVTDDVIERSGRGGRGGGSGPRPLPLRVRSKRRGSPRTRP